MTWAEFIKHFRENQEIGRSITDDHLDVFFDNGTHVGRLRQNRRTTEGDGIILSDAEAAACRDWAKRQQGERER